MTGSAKKQRFLLLALIWALVLANFIQLIETGGQEVPLWIKGVLAGLALVYFISRFHHFMEYQRQAKWEKAIEKNREEYHRSNGEYQGAIHRWMKAMDGVECHINMDILKMPIGEKAEYYRAFNEELAEKGVKLGRMGDVLKRCDGMFQRYEDMRLNLLKNTGLDLNDEALIPDKIRELKGKKKELQVVLAQKSYEIVEDYRSANLGLKGEHRVTEELKLYKDLMTTYPNLRFEVDGESVETDALVLSPYGIFSIEVKNLGSEGNYSIRIEKEGRWLKEYPDGSSEVMEQNVTAQTYRHIALTQRLINRELQRSRGLEKEEALDYASYLEIHPVIVIANERVGIINEGEEPVVRVSNIYQTMKKQTKSLSKENIDEVRKIIEKHRLPLKHYPVEDIVSYYQNVEKSIEVLEESYQDFENAMTEMINRMEKV